MKEAKAHNDDSDTDLYDGFVDDRATTADALAEVDRLLAPFGLEIEQRDDGEPHILFRIIKTPKRRTR